MSFLIHKGEYPGRLVTCDHCTGYTIAVTDRDAALFARTHTNIVCRTTQALHLTTQHQGTR